MLYVCQNRKCDKPCFYFCEYLDKTVKGKDIANCTLSSREPKWKPASKSKIKELLTHLKTEAKGKTARRYSSPVRIDFET